MTPVQNNNKSTFAIICLLFGSLVIGLIATGLLQLTLPNQGSRASYLIGATLQGVLCFILPALITAYIFCNHNVKRALALTRPSLSSILGSALIYLAYLPALNFITSANAAMHLPKSMSKLENWFRTMEDAAAKISETILATTTVSGLITGIIVVAAIAAFSEELFFRSALQRILAGNKYWGLNGKRKNQLAIWIAALVFSIMHFQMFGFVPRLLLGALFGYLLLWSGSVWPGIFVHFLNNALVVISSWSVANKFISESATEFGTMQNMPWLAVVSAIGGTLIVICFRKKLFAK